jgi:ubiquinone/menaquinone biosynthesis C-methylase UbiE
MNTSTDRVATKRGASAPLANSMTMLKKLKKLKNPKTWRRRLLGLVQKEPAVTEFKTAFWQSETGAQSFQKGSDGNEVPTAAIMDAVVNGFFLEHCPKHSKVLDVGSGHGIVSIFLAKHGHSVTACDVSEPLLKTLAQNGAGLSIQIRKGDAHKIPATDGEFDVIVARMFLGHFPDWPDILKEMARCCRPGGKLLIHFTSKENADVGKNSGRHDCKFVDSPDPSQPGGYCAAAHELEIQKACAQSGLKILSRAPNTFFLHNRLIGHALGLERYQAYQHQALEFFKDDKIREFVIWFEQSVTQHMPVWFSYYNVLVLEKP